MGQRRRSLHQVFGRDYGFLKTKFNAGEAASSQTMGLSPQAFSPTKERIDENHPWVTDDGEAVMWPKYCRYGVKHYIINQSSNQCQRWFQQISTSFAMFKKKGAYIRTFLQQPTKLLNNNMVITTSIRSEQGTLKTFKDPKSTCTRINDGPLVDQI